MSQSSRVAVISVVVFIVGLGLVFFQGERLTSVLLEDKLEINERFTSLAHVLLYNPTISKGIWCVTSLKDPQMISKDIEYVFKHKIKPSCSLWIGKGNEYNQEITEKQIFSVISECKGPVLIQIDESKTDRDLSNFLEGIIDDSSPVVRLDGKQVVAKGINVIMYSYLDESQLKERSTGAFIHRAKSQVSSKWTDRFVQRFIEFVWIGDESI